MLELSAGDLRLVLAPETGGAIAAFTYRGIELLRPVADPRLAAQHGSAVAGYPLIPFANRVAGGRFSFGGEAYQLARNFGEDVNTIHGNAWMHPWAVAGSSAQQARLTLDFVPDGDLAAQWPFAYRAEQVFTLTQDALRIGLSVHNRDSRPFPAGIGLHPYVARTKEATLRFQADSLWTTGPDGLPATREAVRGEAEFAEGRLLGTAAIDNCYAGWGGLAVVCLPEEAVCVVLSSGAPMDHLQLYTPPGRDFIGLEPVSNMPDALNRMDEVADHGLVVLQPGATLSASVEIGVRAADG